MLLRLPAARNTQFSVTLKCPLGFQMGIAHNYAISETYFPTFEKCRLFHEKLPRVNGLHVRIETYKSYNFDAHFENTYICTYCT